MYFIAASLFMFFALMKCITFLSSIALSSVLVAGILMSFACVKFGMVNFHVFRCAYHSPNQYRPCMALSNRGQNWFSWSNSHVFFHEARPWPQPLQALVQAASENPSSDDETRTYKNPNYTFDGTHSNTWNGHEWTVRTK